MLKLIYKFESRPIMQNNKSSNQADEPKINLEDYKDLDGLTLKKLETGLWLVEHKKIFLKSLKIFLAVLSVASWGYVFYGLSYYLFFGMQEDNKLITEMAETDGINHQTVLDRQPRELKYDELKVLKSYDDKKYDFIARLSNANAKHWATFEYFFIVDGKETKKQASFIFPNENKYIFSLADEFEYSPSGAELKIENLVWKRLPRSISNWSEYKDQHLKFYIKEIKFSAARTSGLSEKIGLGDLEFQASNFTAFNYYKVPFLTLFYSQGSIVEINRYNIDNFNSGETKIVKANYLDQSGRVDKIEPIPDLNILDETIYKDFEGGVDDSIYEVDKKR